MISVAFELEVKRFLGESLKVVATMSVGVSHIDLKAMKDRGIRLGHAPYVGTEAVAELTIGLTIAVARRMVEAQAQILK